MLATLGLVLAVCAAGSVAQGMSIERVGPPSPGYGVVAMPDGGVARLSIYDYAANVQRIKLVAPSGSVRYIHGPRGVVALGTLPTVLADGSLAFGGELLYDDAGVVRDRTAHVLVTLPRRGPARAVRLSNSGADATWSATAIAPDGAAWRARVCGGLLSRTAPDGTETRIHLPPQRCRAEVVARHNAAFAFGPNGAVWVASLCQAWIARVPLVGRARTWRLSERPRCRTDYDELHQPPPRLLTTADGGLRFANGRIDSYGRLDLDSRGLVPDAIGPDGAEWRVTPRAINRRSRSGRVTRTSVPGGDEPFGDGPRQFVGGTIGPDGRFWYLSGVPVDEQSLGWHNAWMHVGAVDAAGHMVDQPLPDGEGADVAMQPVAAAGAVWLNAPRAALRVRVRPSGPPIPEARATHFLARRGATVWIQLRCNASPGTFCNNVVGLSVSWGRVAVHRARFAIPGGGA